jgi:Flp pilus assembly protein TadG
MNQTAKGQQPAHSRRQRGVIMVLTIIMITSLLSVMALSVDLGFVFSMRTQYQNGIDAAALAGATSLRTAVEGDATAPEQAKLVRAQARLFASLNEVRRYNDPSEPGQPNANAIAIEDSAITIETTGDLPRVTVDSRIVGVYNMQVGARAVATVFPVDGGIGAMAAGTGTNAGCWRPIVLPDTFYDSNSIPHYLFEDAGGGLFREPSLAGGDYYRSRFAAGARNVEPFVRGVGPFVTGLRDTQNVAEIGTRTIMGQPVKFRWDSYFVADFSGLPRATFDVLTVNEWANFGYCGQVRVGDELPVYPRGDSARAEQVRAGLIALKSRTIDFDPPFATEQDIFHYVVSNSYPGPNTHGAIIPVLFYNPFQYSENPTRLRVTNIGLFLLNAVDADGGLSGYFVREIIGGGTPISPANFQADTGESFKKTWLPMSVQLQR